MLRSYPCLFGYRRATLHVKAILLQTYLGVPVANAVRFPAYFGYSLEKRVGPRAAFLTALTPPDEGDDEAWSSSDRDRERRRGDDDDEDAGFSMTSTTTPLLGPFSLQDAAWEDALSLPWDEYEHLVWPPPPPPAPRRAGHRRTSSSPSGNTTNTLSSMSRPTPVSMSMSMTMPTSSSMVGGGGSPDEDPRRAERERNGNESVGWAVNGWLGDGGAWERVLQDVMDTQEYRSKHGGDSERRMAQALDAMMEAAATLTMSGRALPPLVPLHGEKDPAGSGTWGRRRPLVLTSSSSLAPGSSSSLSSSLSSAALASRGDTRRALGTDGIEEIDVDVVRTGEWPETRDEDVERERERETSSQGTTTSMAVRATRSSTSVTSSKRYSFAQFSGWLTISDAAFVEKVEAVAGRRVTMKEYAAFAHAWSARNRELLREWIRREEEREEGWGVEGGWGE